MADGNLKTEISRNESENTASNVIFTQIADDGGNVASITAGALDVNATVTLDTAYTDGSTDFTVQVSEVNAQGYLVDDTATDAVGEGEIGLARMTTDRIMITDAQQRGTWDIGTVTTLTGITNDVNIADGGNSITVDGTVAATQSGVWNIGTVTTLTGITNDVNIADGGNSITVDAVDLDIRDLSHTTDSVEIGDGTDTLAVNADGSINVVRGNAAAGTAIADYDVSAATAQAGTDNHDYTVANTTFYLNRVVISGSGRMKAEIQAGPLASLVTKMVLFKKRDETEVGEFTPGFPVPATSTGTVRVIRTQRSTGSLFMYSTIEGDDV